MRAGIEGHPCPMMPERHLLCRSPLGTDVSSCAITGKRRKSQRRNTDAAGCYLHFSRGINVLTRQNTYASRRSDGYGISMRRVKAAQAIVHIRVSGLCAMESRHGIVRAFARNDAGIWLDGMSGAIERTRISRCAAGWKRRGVHPAGPPPFTR